MGKYPSTQVSSTVPEFQGTLANGATSQCSFFVFKTKQRKELNIYGKEQKFE